MWCNMGKGSLRSGPDVCCRQTRPLLLLYKLFEEVLNLLRGSLKLLIGFLKLLRGFLILMRGFLILLKG